MVEVAASKTGKSPGLVPFQLVMGVMAGALAGIIAILGELRDQFQFDDTSVGVIVTVGLLSAFVAQIALGAQADRGHAQVMLRGGLAIAVVAAILMTFVSGVAAWSLARGLYGFGVGLAFPALRRVASVLDAERVGENLGRLMAGEIGGFLVGPVVAGLLVEVGGIRLPFIVSALALVLLVPVALRLPTDHGDIDVTRRLVALDLLSRRRLVAALTLVAGYFLLIGGFEAVIPLMYTDRGASPVVTGVAFASFALPLIIISTPAGRWADRFGPPRLATGGIAIVAASASLYGILPGYIWPAVVMAAAGFADGVGLVGVQVAVARAVPETRQAGALGLMGATQVLAAGLSATPAAHAYGRFGAGVTWVVLSVSTLMVVAVGAALFAGTRPAR